MPTPRILIADDEPITRMLVKFLLEKERFEVLEATNGDEDFTKMTDADFLAERYPDAFTAVIGSLSGSLSLPSTPGAATCNTRSCATAYESGPPTGGTSRTSMRTCTGRPHSAPSLSW